MIDFIRGKIAELSPTGVILDVNGIGYEINITLPTYSLLVDKTESKLFVYESIRDDSHDLYGFLTKGERQLFLALITVSGVGPGSARMILSTYTAAEIRQEKRDDRRGQSSPFQLKVLSPAVICQPDGHRCRSGPWRTLRSGRGARQPSLGRACRGKRNEPHPSGSPGTWSSQAPWNRE